MLTKVFCLELRLLLSSWWKNESSPQLYRSDGKNEVVCIHALYNYRSLRHMRKCVGTTVSGSWWHNNVLHIHRCHIFVELTVSTFNQGGSESSFWSLMDRTKTGLEFRTSEVSFILSHFKRNLYIWMFDVRTIFLNNLYDQENPDIHHWSHF